MTEGTAEGDDQIRLISTLAWGSWEQSLIARPPDAPPRAESIPCRESRPAMPGRGSETSDWCEKSSVYDIGGRPWVAACAITSRFHLIVALIR